MARERILDDALDTFATISHPVLTAVIAPEAVRASFAQASIRASIDRSPRLTANIPKAVLTSVITIHKLEGE